MKNNKFFIIFCIIICLFAMIHVACYAEIKVANENKSIHQLSSLNKEMRELYQFDSKYEEIRNLFLEKNIYFEDIKDYFYSNGSIKLFDFCTTGELVSYAGEINETDYIRLKNNVQSICSEKDNFAKGMGANFIGGTLEENKTDRSIIFWKGDYSGIKNHCLYFEYLIYGEDVSDRISNQKVDGWHVIKKGISPKWNFSQSIETEKKWRNDCLSDESNSISNEKFTNKALSYEKIKKIIIEHSDVFEKYVKLLKQDKKNKFSYSNYIDFKRTDDGQVYKNYNIASYENAEPKDAAAMHVQQEMNIIPYCKETEKFIAFLKENNIVLPVGVSIETSFSEDGAFQLKIFTRSQCVNDRCFNVTVVYNSADKQIKAESIVEENTSTWLSELITPPKPLEQEIILHWYYIEDVGRWGGLYQGK